MDEVTVEVTPAEAPPVETPPVVVVEPPAPAAAPAQVPEEVLAQFMQLQQRVTDMENRHREIVREMVSEYRVEWMQEQINEINEKLAKLQLAEEPGAVAEEPEEGEPAPAQEIPPLPEIQPAPQPAVETRKRPWWL